MTDENINNNEDAVEPQVEPEDGTEKLKQQLGQAKDKYIRLFADFDNMRKRHERERVALIKYAHEEVIIEMLGFLEDFERTIAAARKDPSAAKELLKGIEMVYGRMQQLLKKYDVREIECTGKKFDPGFHEALMVEDAADEEDGTILEVFQKGYMLGDRVVRTAKVKVSKKS